MATRRKINNPGRLNDLRHIFIRLLKSHGDALEIILGLCLEGILKENIDGEALDWAHKDSISL